MDLGATEVLWPTPQRTHDTWFLSESSQNAYNAKRFASASPEGPAESAGRPSAFSGARLPCQEHPQAHCPEESYLRPAAGGESLACATTVPLHSTRRMAASRAATALCVQLPITH